MLFDVTPGPLAQKLSRCRIPLCKTATAAEVCPKSFDDGVAVTGQASRGLGDDRGRCDRP